MGADPTKAYNQGDATGFIRLNGLRLRVNSTVNGAGSLSEPPARSKFGAPGTRITGRRGGNPRLRA